jgi:hypothetical protein
MKNSSFTFGTPVLDQYNKFSVVRFGHTHADNPTGDLGNCNCSNGSADSALVLAGEQIFARTPDGGQTIIMVMRPSELGNYMDVLTMGYAETPRGSYGIAVNSDGKVQAWVPADNGQQFVATDTVTNLSTSEFAVIMYQVDFDALTLTLRTNGAVPGIVESTPHIQRLTENEINTTGEDRENCGGGLTLGGHSTRWCGGSECKFCNPYYRGDVAELFLYTGVLDADYLDGILDDLCVKYQIDCDDSISGSGSLLKVSKVEKKKASALLGSTVADSNPEDNNDAEASNVWELEQLVKEERAELEAIEQPRAQDKRAQRRSRGEHTHHVHHHTARV